MEFIDTKSLDKELNKLLTAFQTIGAAGFPATKMSVGKSAAFIEQTWVNYASGQQIPGQTKTVDNTEYRNSITRQKINDFDWMVFSSNEKVADRIEDGKERVDLKEHLPFPKSKKAAAGHYYSVIPFRHKRNTISRAVPQKVAADVFKMEKSYVSGTYVDEAGIKRYVYRWAKRDKQLQRKLKGTRLAGIVRFETSAGKGKSSSYMTFRVISQKSPAHKWIIAAQPGIPITKVVSEQTRDMVNKIIKNGIEQDLQIL